MIVGPGVLGGAVASADLFGIDFDFFCHDKKSNNNSRVAGQPSTLTVGGGRAASLPPVPTAPITRGSAPAATSAGSGGGGGPLSGGDGARRPGAPVSTAPNVRSVVIHTEPSESSAPPIAASAAPLSVSAPLAPAVVPPVVVPPVPVVVPIMPPAPVVVPNVPPAFGHPYPPTTQPPRTIVGPGPADSLRPVILPESFRAGYPDYLREATVSDLLGVALPGVAGILAFTMAGGVLGYRQARAGQALPASGVARFLS